MSQRRNELEPRAPTAAERLLRSTRSDYAPSSADRERVRSALASKLAQGGAASPTAAEGPLFRAFSTIRALGTGVKATLGLGLLAAVAFTSLRVSEHAKPTAISTERAVVTGQPSVHSAEAPPPATTPSVAPPASPAPTVRRQLERSTADGARSKARGRSTRRAAEAVLEQPEPLQPASASSEAPHNFDSPTDLGVESQNTAAVSGTSTQARPDRSNATQPNPPPRAAPSSNSRAPEKPSAASTAEDASDARAELAFVRRIQVALVESKPERVLALCDAHARRWPHGTFEQEREGLRAIAACQSVLASGPALAHSFIAKYPQSPMLPRVREACPPLR